MAEQQYQLLIAPSAARTLTKLPQKIVAAVHKFRAGPLLDNPHRVGKALDPALAPLWSARRGTYRVLYTIDDTNGIVEVAAVGHRADIYRP